MRTLRVHAAVNPALTRRPNPSVGRRPRSIAAELGVSFLRQLRSVGRAGTRRFREHDARAGGAWRRPEAPEAGCAGLDQFSGLGTPLPSPAQRFPAAGRTVRHAGAAGAEREGRGRRSGAPDEPDAAFVLGRGHREPSEGKGQSLPSAVRFAGVRATHEEASVVRRIRKINLVLEVGHREREKSKKGKSSLTLIPCARKTKTI